MARGNHEITEGMSLEDSLRCLKAKLHVTMLKVKLDTITNMLEQKRNANVLILII